MTVQATFAATLVEEWVRAGVTHAVVSPGSRSTPLALALAAEAKMCLHVVLDERSAGFLALGIGIATGRPAVVLTTSGTAAVELHPAVVEASLAGVPMVVCTANRPPELHEVGAPQTIDQHHLYGGAVRWFVAPGVADASSSGTWRSLAARAVLEATAATRGGPGPVHLDLAFRDPLVAAPGPLPPGRPEGAPWHVAAAVTAVPDAALARRLAMIGRGLLVVGEGAGPAEVVHRAAVALGWPVLADARSGARLDGSQTVTTADSMLRDPVVAAALRPDVVVHLGAPWASKVLGQWLAGAGGEHVLVDPFGRWIDPDRTATTVVAADPTAMCEQLFGAATDDRLGRPGRVDGAWPTMWRGCEAATTAALAAEMDRAGTTEPSIAAAMLRGLPDGATLVTSSSMPVRDVEWFTAGHPLVRIVANRGANGIDGVVSTAVGVALDGGPAALLIGDLAFLHDSGGLLAGASLAPEPDVSIVVVDNGGGGIFSFLPQRSILEAPLFERLFATPQPSAPEAVAAAHGWHVTPLDDAVAVASFAAGVVGGGRRVGVVHTDRAANVVHHEALHKAMAGAARRALPTTAT